MTEQEKIDSAPEAVNSPVEPSQAPAEQPRSAVLQDAAPAEDVPTPALRRRGRPRKAAPAEPAAEAPAASPDAFAADSAGSEQDAPAPVKRRRGRPRKAERPEEREQEAVKPLSADVAAARALSQVSQAEVARKQRAEEDRAAALIASGDLDIPAAAAALIDPSLRPHRRGRKPKAYIEAEKRAAAQLAAQQAEYMARIVAGRDKDAEGAQPASAPAPAEGAVEDAPAADVRPGRGRRAKEAREGKETARQEQAPQGPAPEAPAEAREGEEAERRPRKRRRDRQQDERDGGRERGGEASERADRRDRNDRGDRNGRGDRNDRQQNGRNKRGNRQQNAPTEPTLSREDLSAMKVAELREKAKEFKVDYVGKKKAELVEGIYRAAAEAEGFREIEGILDIDRQGFGYIRAHGYMPSRDDAFVAQNVIRGNGLRPGDLVAGSLRPARANDKFPGLAKIHQVNGMDPELARQRPRFSDLTPVYPQEQLRMENGRDSITGRAIDIVAPIGKGQRGLIVSPPKAGKTTVLKHICRSIAANNPEVHLICLLVDERPEEVTDMRRSIKGEVVASTFDMPADNHTRVSELVIERAKRLVEQGGDVVVVLDSITRLARAYNIAAPVSGRILSGGVDSAALYPPKKFLGAARNIEDGGSLTILASALVETGSKMDEVIFEEFKGTGNMELKLDRGLADRRIFPAIDPVASGTRNEELLCPDPQMRPLMWGIRRILAGMGNTERAAASFIKGLKGTESNFEFLTKTAKKAQEHTEAL